MALQNDFLPFATGPGANVLSQSAYAALSAVSTGYQAGVASSNQLNKTWRQSSIMAAVIAQLINNNAGQPAVDDGTTATLLANLTTAISVIARQNPVLADTGTANAYVVANPAALTAYPTVSGLTIDVSIANTNTGASTLNVDGLGTKPIIGLGLQPLQGGELPQKGVACLMYVVASTVNGGNGAWIVMECTGGAQQVAPAAQSQHALQLGQLGSLPNNQNVSTGGKVNGTNNPNLLINGSAEFGSAGWSFTTLSATSDTSGGIGSYFTNLSTVSGGALYETSANIQVTAGVALTLSLDVGAPGASSGTFSAYIQPYNSGGTPLASLPAINAAAGSAVARLASQGTTPANTAYVRVVLFLNGINAAAYGVIAKRIKVELGTTPTLYSQEASLAGTAQYRQAAGNILAIRRFTSNGTYTPTAGTVAVRVQVVGGGGGGGGSNTTGSGQQSVGAGGAGGSYAESYLTSGFSGAALTIGAGGSAGAVGGNGGNGGTTSFGALLSASGGGGGQTIGATGSPFILAGGVTGTMPTTGNLINGQGTPGGVGFAPAPSSSTSFLSGAGGASLFGGGASPLGSSNSAGNAGASYGSGGSGGCTGASSTGQIGGAGAAGVIIVTEYGNIQ
ncbi:hypothetical protein LMG6871_02818 [Ralstonia edaphis]|uniref:glycine-rich domain-containing protein n=1 Tax=Ralstonia edaphi TaxID=3058599 RepID=UPI0028F61AA1|nr:hypothetical protein [Ralstonia sp. LMG 6871]CAJ0719368.1 hypothetical protein LMG6871_02818 [Ralstonia sp. LMG 6871]